jgi:carbamoyl-phosphate synthase large subunit
MADSFGLAFYKAQEATQSPLPLEGTVLITISDEDKASALQTAKEFEKLGFKILATEGTHKLLTKNGVKSEHILKMHEGRPNILDSIKNGQIQLVINTPNGKQSKHDDSYIRKAAIKYKIPYITTAAAAAAAAKGIAAFKKKPSQIKSLQEYHADIK